MTDKSLVLITSTYPFGQREAYLENEIKYLAASFSKIYILVHAKTAEDKRPVPDNCHVYEIHTGNTNASLFSLFSVADIYRELCYIVRTAKLKHWLQNARILFFAIKQACSIYPSLLQFIKKENLHNALYYSYWLDYYALTLAVAKKKGDINRAIARAHGWDVYYERHNPPYLPLRHLILNNINACYTISENGAAYMNEKTGGLFDDKIKVSRLGIFNDTQAPAVSADKFYIISCSGVIPLKRLHLIIEALSKIEHISISWIHFGGGPILDEVSSFAASVLNPKSNIDYHFAGPVNNTILMQYYANHAVDLFINVSETEGIPVAIMEANSFGIPAIATHVGGVSEVVNNHNGFLIDVNSSAVDIAKIIIHYAGLSVEAQQQYRKNAYNTWSTLYNAQKNYTAFVDGVINL